MGEDSVTPFLTYEGKWVILLALTSNKGSHDFQLTEDPQGERLFEKVLRKSQEWASDEQMMYVVGATQGRAFEDIRKIVPEHFLLVPGVGAQGGSLEEVCKYGMTKTCGLIVNSSRLRSSMWTRRKISLLPVARLPKKCRHRWKNN